ncbi:MAG: pseudouridine synthase [Syntrophorhabdales bacterium]|jgi:pseudouridine synthase
MAQERLAKFLARSGAGSRRKSEDIIRSGRVTVNGIAVNDPSHTVDPAIEIVTLDGTPILPAAKRYYIALYKPIGYLSDLADIKGKSRPLARRLIDLDAPLFPVGRLDYNSEGLIIFTNDGDFANMVMHPRYEVEKEYHVKLSGALTAHDLRRMASGLSFEGHTYRFKTITPLKSTDKNTWYKVVVAEGKYHHIRKIAEAVSHPVLRLRRVRIDGITLGHLKPGQWTRIHPREIGRLLPASHDTRTGDPKGVHP